MTDETAAELRGATKRFGKVLALDRLDLQVRRGELLAILGANGAGKSTAISLLLGLRRPDGGTAAVFGRSPLLLETRRQVGVMMQEVGFPAELRVRELVDLVASYYPKPLTVDDALAATRTQDLALRPYGKLSPGQKRQVQFALAIVGRPSLLVLDEPTVGLDVNARETMGFMLRRLVGEGSAIVLTTHYLEEAESLADRVTVLAKGRVLAEGTVDAIRALVTRRHIRCTTALAAEAVAAWPRVESALRDGRQLHVTASDAEAVVRRLLAVDETLTDLEVRRAGLAEAFLELTKEVA
ncbi:MAG: ABC transporter ATP-binding protein [Planctomycetes bacterium]|nr:ABC transporter ATP-binding protein [Planctomycetota bacterium]MBI3847761.1 ABC transporter ATP-binding protein [Planctomycetota bacterium]